MNSNPDTPAKELAISLRLKAIQLDSIRQKHFPNVLSIEWQMLNNSIYVMHKAADTLENGDLQS